MKAHFSKVLYETQRKDTFLKVKNEMQRPLSLRMMVLAFAYLLRNESFLHKKLPQPYRSNGYSTTVVSLLCHRVHFLFKLSYLHFTPICITTKNDEMVHKVLDFSFGKNSY